MTARWLAEALAVRPGRSVPAIVLADGVLDRADLRRLVSEQRAALVAAGIGPGSTVSVQVAPGVGYLAVVLAALELDSRVLLLHHRIGETERQASLAGFRPAATVSSPPAGALSRFRLTDEVQVRAHADADRSGPGAAVVQFSSGSTGQPKVIERTEASIAAELAGLLALPDWVSDQDRLLTLNSLEHSFGLFGAVLHSLRVGCPLVFAATALPADLQAALCGPADRPELAPTAITGVPAHFELLTALPPAALSRLRLCVSGGQLLTGQSYQRFLDRHQRRIGQAYGLTELGLVAADLTGRFAPAAGPVLPGHRVRVVGDGELQVAVERSPYLAGGQGRLTADGWLRTGDRARLDGQLLTVLGRSDSLLAIGGLKVDLGEVEATLAAAPGVRAAVVLAWGEAIQAFVEADQAGAEELRAWCERSLARHKQPRRIVVLPRLPRTVNGKYVRDPAQLQSCLQDTQ